VINSKAIFDVLKKIASRSSEIQRSDPLPLKSHSFQQFKKILLFFILHLFQRIQTKLIQRKFFCSFLFLTHLSCRSVPPPPIGPPRAYPPTITRAPPPPIVPRAFYPPPVTVPSPGIPQQPRYPVPPTSTLQLPKPTSLLPPDRSTIQQPQYQQQQQQQPQYQPQPQYQQTSWAGQVPPAHQPGPAYPVQAVVAAPPTKGLDFAAILNMNPGEEMLRYIQVKKAT
jgi:hypothetical protein